MRGKILLRKGAYQNLITLKLVFIALLLTCISADSFSQANDKSTATSNNSIIDLDRVVVGGGFGATFGTITQVDISPNIGYKVKDFWLLGVGARYLYYSDKRFNPAFKTNIYGGGPFTQLVFLENFVVHSEFEVLSLERLDSFDERINVASWLAGGGYRSSIGDRSFVNMMILWNLLDDVNSPYSNPVIRIGFGVGL